jgi:chromosomal replication initiation ATPase DnaA
MTPPDPAALTRRMQQLDHAITALIAEQAAIWAALRHLGSDGAFPRTTQGQVRQIIEAVAAEWRVTVDDILSDRRQQPIAQARQVAMWLARHCTLLSAPVIGRAFRRDHTTVLHGVEVVELRLGTDGELAARLADMQAELHARFNPASDHFAATPAPVKEAA